MLLSKSEQNILNKNKIILTEFSFEFDIDKSKLQLNAVPKLLRKANWQNLLPKLIELLLSVESTPELEVLIYEWLAEQYLIQNNEQSIIWNIPKAMAVLTELEQLNESDIIFSDIIKPIDFSTIISLFK